MPAIYDHVTPKASEITASLKFYGADQGTFPATTANTALSNLKFNSLKLSGGEETRDFKAGQQIMALERIVGQASAISGQLNLTSPNSFLKAYQTNGPLVEMTITITDASQVSADTTIVFKGLMKLPDMDFLSNPGVIDFEIRPYGATPLMTHPA